MMETNLARRFAAASVLVPVVLMAVAWLPSPCFSVGAAVFLAVACWEWAGLSEWGSPARRAAYVALNTGLLLALFLLGPEHSPLLAFCMAGAAWWVVALRWVLHAQQGRPSVALGVPWLHWLCGWLTLVPAWSALVYLHQRNGDGRWWVLLLFVLVWSADIGAYFSGRRFGRRRLASRVSPGKSWEGVLGGSAACLLIGIALTLYLGGDFSSPWVLPALCVGVAVLGVLGDLFESLLKRRAGTKDSGMLIPGHGGVLDRIDSLSAAAPCFALGIVLLFGS